MKERCSVDIEESRMMVTQCKQHAGAGREGGNVISVREHMGRCAVYIT
jgi:hypothetical protein